MKKFSGVIFLVIVSLMILFITGCTETSKSNSKDSKDAAQQQTTQEAASASNDGSDDGATAAQPSTGTDSSDSDSTGLGDPRARLESFSEEEQQIMGQLTGTWEQQTPGPDGSTNIVRAKIDNVSGFTLTTGTVNAAGEGTYYSHVGSYEVLGDMIRFSATTGGESNDGSSYTLRMDPGVYEYKYSENPELTQLVLTPDNDNARNLTGGDTLTLAKT